MAGKQARKERAVLFSGCLGLNNNTQRTAAKYNEDGLTEVIGCKNLTVTPDGKLIKIPGFASVLTAAATIDNLAAGKRMFVQAGTSMKEFNGATLSALTVSPVFTAGVKGRFIFTPVDTRISVGSPVATQYKIPHENNTAVVCALGNLATLPSRSLTFSKMPDFAEGFVYTSKLYTVNLADKRFLQYSEDYFYDVFNLADNFIGHKQVGAVLQAGAIPGCIAAVHETGVSCYFGSGQNDFIKKFFPLKTVPGTMVSGFFAALNTYAHLLLCEDGVYTITADGKASNLTENRLTGLDKINTSYSAVLYADGKYLAFGNSKLIEFDLLQKTLMLHDNFSISSGCVWKNQAYFAVGDTLLKQNDEATKNTAAVQTQVILPYNDFGTSRTKQIRFLYFTGEITGVAKFTVRSQSGSVASKIVSNIGYVEKYKIDGFRPCKGEKLSVEITTEKGFFKLEELRASFFSVN